MNRDNAMTIDMMMIGMLPACDMIWLVGASKWHPPPLLSHIQASLWWATLDRGKYEHRSNKGSPT